MYLARSHLKSVSAREWCVTVSGEFLFCFNHSIWEICSFFCVLSVCHPLRWLLCIVCLVITAIVIIPTLWQTGNTTARSRRNHMEAVVFARNLAPKRHSVIISNFIFYFIFSFQHHFFFHKIIIMVCIFCIQVSAYKQIFKNLFTNAMYFFDRWLEWMNATQTSNINLAGLVEQGFALCCPAVYAKTSLA